jgi:tetratricopeptide (TPR) repeat protein
MQAQHLVRQAKEQMAATNFDKAVVTLDKALEFDPGNEYIIALRDEAARKAKALELMYKGEVQMSKGHDEKAAEILMQALALDPDSAEIKDEVILEEKRVKSHELLRQGDAQTAAGMYLLDGTVLAMPEDFEAERRAAIRTQLGNAKSKAKHADNHERVVGLIEQADTQAKLQDVTSLRTSLQLLQTVEFEAALATYKMALELNPTSHGLPDGELVCRRPPLSLPTPNSHQIHTKFTDNSLGFQ